MKPQIKCSLNAGLTFGIVTLFLYLIGFTTTASQIIQNLLKLEPESKVLGMDALPFSFALFLGLIGLWAGVRQARAMHKGHSVGVVLGSAALTGLVHGLIVALVAYVTGSLNASGVKLNTYLSQLLPASVQLFLFDQPPATGAFLQLGFLTLTSFLGGALVYGLTASDIFGRLAAAWRSLWSRVNDLPAVAKFRASPAFNYVAYGLAAVFLLLLPLRAGQYWNYTLGTVGIYVLLGLGLNIVVGLAGLLNLGYVAFFAIGAYTVSLLTAPSPHGLVWDFWLVLPIGILAATLVGILLVVPVLRMRGDYLAIVTLGFGEIIRILSKSDALTWLTGGPKGVNNVGGPALFGRTFDDVGYLYLIFLSVLLAIFVTRRLQNSRVGRAWESMREDETVSRAMGINILRHKVLAFAIGAAFAGLGVVLFAARNQFTGPEDHNMMVSINVLSAVIVGGMGSIPGVIAGAFVLKGLPEILRELENYRVLAFAALLVVMMLVRPSGILPASRRKFEFQSGDESSNRGGEGSAK